MNKNELLQKNNTLINPNGPEGKVSAENHREVNLAIIEYLESTVDNKLGGWTRDYEAVKIGDKIVHQVTGYYGGTGTAPTDYIGLYYKDGGGFTSDPAQALNFSDIALKKAFNPTNNTEAATMKATNDWLSGIKFENDYMLLPGADEEIYYTTDFSDWLGYNGGQVSTDASGSFAEIPNMGIVYVEGLTYPATELVFKIKVEAGGPVRLMVDDSTTPAGLEVMLVAGENTVNFDATGHTDKTIILRNEGANVAKIRELKIIKNTPNAAPVKIPTKIYSALPYNETFYEKIKNFLPSDFSAVNIQSTINNGVINLKNPAGSLVNNRAVFNYKTLHENSEAEIIYREVTGAGLFFGFISENQHGYSHHVLLAFNTSGGNLGKMLTYTGSAGNIVVYDPINTDYSIGDVIKLGIIRKGLIYTFTTTNLTRGWKIEKEVKVNPLGVPFVAHNQAELAVTLAAGEVDILGVRFISHSTEIDNYIAGDSITFGQSATDEAKRWASLVNGNNIISGGGADTSYNVKARLDEIIKINPRRVLLMIGGNDILFSVSPNQNLKDIRNTLTGAGIEVVHLLPTPRAGASTLINFIKNEPDFITDLKIDTNTPLSNGGPDLLLPAYDSGDALHPNNAGMAKIAEIINAVLF